MNARAEPTAIQAPNVFSTFARQWRVIDVPLRPHEDDVAVYASVVDAWQRAHRERRARGLLLGVTAEIATMNWPRGASLVAVDHSFPMVANVWPKPPHGTAVCADWRTMPLPDRSRDVALGDGCLTLLSIPDARDAFARNLKRVLVDDGVLALRCFCRPEETETPRQVLDDLEGGRVRGFHAFKWRFVMAVHGSAENGVRLADVWDCWSAEVRDPDALAARCGWPLESVRSMQVYRDSETRYLFSTVEESRRSLAPWFTLESQHVGDYELAERCPILVFRPA
jgi:SAM-dependent methyltransferase